MLAFSINQSMGLYVGTKIECPVPHDAQVGTIGLKKGKEDIWVEYMGQGGPQRSDLVNKENIMWVTATSSDDMRHYLKRTKIIVNQDCLKECKDYFARVIFPQHQSLSEEDTYIKHAYGRTCKEPNAGKLVRDMALSLANSFTAIERPLIKVFISDSDDETAPGTLTEVKRGAKKADLPESGKAIVIEEVAQPRHCVYGESLPVFFEVSLMEGDACCCDWAKTAKLTPENFVENGGKVADYEQFHYGFRQDIYRGIGYPNVHCTKYIVDPEKKYDIITLHYFYRGDNHAVQRSEKDLAFVFENDGSHTLTNQFIAELNTVLPENKQLKTL